MCKKCVCIQKSRFLFILSQFGVSTENIVLYTFLNFLFTSVLVLEGNLFLQCQVLDELTEIKRYFPVVLLFQLQSICRSSKFIFFPFWSKTVMDLFAVLHMECSEVRNIQLRQFNRTHSPDGLQPKFLTYRRDPQILVRVSINNI